MSRVTFAAKSRLLAVLSGLGVLAGLFYLAATSPDYHLYVLHYNPYALLSGTSFLFCFGILIYIIRKPARADERIWLSFYLSALAIFSGSEMIQRLSLFPQTALFWTTMSAIGIAVCPLALYLFSLSYTNQGDSKFPGTTVTLLASGFLITFFYSYTNVVYDNIPGHMKLYPWGFNNDPRDGLFLTLLWVDILSLLAVARFVNFRRRTRNSILRKQSLIFILAAIAPVAVGSITDGILPLFGFVNIPPLAMTFSAITGGLLTYGVLRYKVLTVSPTLFSNTILTIMHESVVALDKDFKIIYLNPEAESLFGIEGSQDKDLALLNFVSTDAAISLRWRLSSELATSGGINLDRVDITRDDKTEVPVRVTGSRLQSADFEAYILVLTDITNELRTKGVIERQVEERTEELHQARAYLVASLNSLEQGFILVNHQAKVELLNGMAKHLTRTSIKEPVGHDLGVVVGAIDWDIDLANATQRVLTSRRSKRLNAATADGLFFTVFITPIISGDEVLGASVILEDVTEARILERSKDEFFSIASHELRTPLTAIRGNMSMVRDYFPEAMKDEALATAVNDAHDASIRLIKIVNDFLDSSRLEQGKMVFHLQPTDMKALIEKVGKDLAPILEIHHNSLNLSGLEDLPLVYADGERVQQIVYDVLDNATKFCENGKITVTAQTAGRMLRLIVSDTGKGISAEGQKLLFHKFQQAADSILTRDSTRGTGMGLYIAKLLASSMKGDVMLEHSQEGKGSTFAITLPIATKQQLAKR